MKKFILLLLLFGLLAVPVSAQEKQIEIHSPQDLLAIGDNPGGSYILMADIDMAGISWPCPAFSGKLDGNGHAILNLTVTQPSGVVKTAYDGNYKPYESRFAGLFSTLENAEIKNLTLLGMNALVTTDSPCFLGGIAGYAYESTVSGCHIQATLELRAHNGMFGVAGVVGYGSGTVKDCQVDVTLICTDTGKDTKDEQFMAGILANGFMDVNGCTLALDAYASEYGYAHTGGLVGMYYQKPFNREHYGKVVHNTVDGKITFFECNDDRRAYCKGDVGEIVATHFGVDFNKLNFTRDERKEYDKELRPHTCEDPVYSEEIVAPLCDSFGYTSRTCQCGYSTVHSYTLKSHNFGPWQVVTQPTAQAPGQSRAVCTLCAQEITRQDAYIPPETTPGPTTPETTAQPDISRPQSQPEKAENNRGLFIVYMVLLAVAAIAAGYFVCQEYKRKHRRRRRRPKF